MLTNKQNAYLRSQAHHLQPTVQIGRLGLTEEILEKVRAELAAHELIKVKFLDYKDEKREMSTTIANLTKAELVTIIGNIAVLYRRHDDPEKRQIRLPN